MRLFDELRRRNVFRVAMAYAIVGWIVLQVGDTIFPAFDAPAWILQATIAIVVMGFPIALVLAWAFELTPRGVKKTEDVDADESITPVTGHRLNFILIGGMIFAIVFFLWQQQDEAPDVGEGVVAEKSIAVLPFVDMSAAGDQEYFADGISEELLNVLVKLPGLKVTGRTSSFQFKGQNLDLPLIGQQLGVTTILEGSVRTQGDRVRITAQLINAADGFHLWSETYDRDMSDIFAVQDEIAREIVTALRVELIGEAPVLVTVGTTNMEAFQEVLRGRFFMAKRTLGDIQRAVSHFERATEFDPGYADAYAGLAAALGVLIPRLDDPDTMGDIRARTIVAANRALELDPLHSQAYAALGVMTSPYSAGEEAERLFRRAIETNPSNPTAYHWFGSFLAETGRADEGLAMLRRALELDPLSLIINKNYGEALYRLDRLDEAEVQVDATLSLDPDFAEAWLALGRIHYELGETDEATGDYVRYASLVGSDGDLTRDWFERIAAGQPTEDLAIPEGIMKGAELELLVRSGRHEEALVLAARIAGGEASGRYLDHDPSNYVIWKYPEFIAMLREAKLLPE